MPESSPAGTGTDPTAGWRGHLYRLAPAILTIFAGYALYAARDMEVGGLQGPGPGMWPVIVAAVMGITAFLLIFRDIPEDYEAWTARTAKVLAGITVLFAFVWFFDVLGFVPSALLLLFIWMKFLAHESWRLSLVLAIAGALVLNFIFADVFAVPFPPGLVVITSGGGA